VFGSASSPIVVLLASVLKPVDDPRMRGKFAETLTERPMVQVHIAGQASANPRTAAAPPQAQIQQHPIFQGARLSLGRLAAQGRYWQLLRQLRPTLVIVHAPELLPLTLLWQALGRKRRFLYDIRENYALNVCTQQVYQGLTRRALAAGLRWMEARAARRSAGVILAEISYADELPFLPDAGNRVVVLENKYQPARAAISLTAPRRLPPAGQPIQLLYSGTISMLNGVWEAICLAETLHHTWPGGIRLTIIGFCQQPELLQWLQAKVARHPDWLTLVGGRKLVPHSQIVAEINRSHFGLLPYQPHPSTERCRPTKLFEYLAHGLPVIASPNLLWEELLHRYEAGLTFDFAQPGGAPALVAQLQGRLFYPAGIPAEASWASEGKKLWHLLDSLD
jgi:glycogen(starch) synthase